MCLSVCLGELLRQKEPFQHCGLETIAVANRPTLCILFGPHENVLHFLKHHRGKMIWHRDQENRLERVEMVSTVSFTLSLTVKEQVTSAQHLPKPH